MTLLWVLVGVALAVAALFLVITYVCFRMAFLAMKEESAGEEEYPIPPGKVYEPYRETMAAWMKEVRQLPHEDMSVTSFDGLTLRGRYYEYAPGAPIELMFHGYRGNAERDLCGGVQRCFALGHSALVVDQRASGRSEGKVITFGVNESRDCHTWLKYMIDRFGSDIQVSLTGISMGAATVLNAAGSPLPKNVTGVLADCGYSTARDIIKKVIADMGLPVGLGYFFVKLGARIYGRFDLEEVSPVEAVKRCTVPVIFFHGEADDFVPCEMSKINYEHCASRKALVTVPGAGHGLCYLVDREGYLKALGDFWGVSGGN